MGYTMAVVIQCQVLENSCLVSGVGICIRCWRIGYM